MELPPFRSFRGFTASEASASLSQQKRRKRKQMMSDAVKYRQEFAAAHLTYIKILQNMGHALSQYADRQLYDLEVTPGSSGKKSVSITDPASSKPSQETFLKPPSSPSKSPAKPPPLASTPSQQGTSHSNSDAKATKKVPVTHENSEPAISNGSFSPNIEFLDQNLTGDVLMSSVPLSPIGSPLPYVLSEPSSPLNSEWDPFNLFPAVRLRSPDLTTRHLQDWDTVSRTYDFVGADGLPELEEDEAGPKKDVYEASKSTAGQAPKKVNATESLVKPEKKLTEANAEKVLERIDEDPEETGEGSPVDVTSKSQEDSAPQKVKDLASITIDRVKQISECVMRINDAFARASESGQEVSEMLETHIVHPQVRILDFTDSFRFGNSISWRGSRNSVSRRMNFYESDDDSENDSSHSLTLEKLYTWEKKLYKEVKVGEQLHIAFSKKSKEFYSADSKGNDPDLIEQCRADMKSLESQLVVAFRAISSASLRIQQVTTDELYPQLIELLRRLKAMWKAMLECHTAQKIVALEIRTIDKSGHKFAASDAHRIAAVELENQLEMWQQCFNPWVVSQQMYIDTLLKWIRICHLEPESTVKKRSAMSPAWTSGKAPIYSLARNWHDSLLCLEENNNVADAINKFLGLVHDVQLSESEELAEMKKAEMLSRSMDRRSHKRAVGRERIQEDKNVSNEVQREDAVLSSLQQHLPRIFEALTTFSSVAYREYEKLHRGADTSTKK